MPVLRVRKTETDDNTVERRVTRSHAYAKQENVRANVEPKSWPTEQLEPRVIETASTSRNVSVPKVQPAQIVHNAPLRVPKTTLATPAPKQKEKVEPVASRTRSNRPNGPIAARTRSRVSAPTALAAALTAIASFDENI